MSSVALHIIGKCKHQIEGLYLFHAVDFHVGIRVHPSVLPVASHCCGALFDCPMAAVADEAHHRYNHGQHGAD